jgi:ABC-type uncharacterized transport system substrate-binding protein
MGVLFILKVLNPKLETANPNACLVALVVLAVLTLALAGCGRGPGPTVVFCAPDSLRMRQAVAGLEAKLGAGPVAVTCVPEFGPEGHATVRRLREAHPRLLVALGTPALMLVAPVEKKIPVVFGLVANPYFTGAAYDPAHPEIHQENVTGIATPPPLTAALQHGAGLLGRVSWGLLYDPADGEAADLARRFTQEAPRFGIKPLTETSAAAATDEPGLERLVARGARVIYLPPAASAARYAPLVLDWGRQMKVQVVSSYPEGPHQGALLWVTLDYRRLGEEIAAMARRVLNGEPPKTIPIEDKTPLQVEVDDTLLRRWSGYPPPIDRQAH